MAHKKPQVMARDGGARRGIWLALAASLATLTLAIHPATAQEDTSGYADFPDVGDRYDGVGRHVGSFWLFPTLEVGPYFDSNVYARSSNVESGAGVYIRPRLEARSDWGRHALNLELDATQFEDLQHSSQSRTDFGGQIDGRLDIQRDLIALGGLRGTYIEDQLGDGNASIYAANPEPHSELNAWASLNKAFNRLSLSVGAAYELNDYQDVKSTPDYIGYPAKVDQDFRDGNSYEVGGRASYMFSPGYRWFNDFRYNWQDYRTSDAANSDGWRALTGLEFELSRLVRGEVGVGYMEQYYNDDSTESALSYHAGLIWNPTMLMTVQLDADRSFQGSTVVGSNGYIEDKLKLTVDYEVLRGVVLTPSFAVALEDYQDVDLSNTTYDAGVKLDHAMNRFLSVGAAYVYTLSDSDDPSNLREDYDRHVIGVYAKARF